MVRPSLQTGPWSPLSVHSTASSQHPEVRLGLPEQLVGEEEAHGPRVGRHHGAHQAGALLLRLHAGVQVNDLSNGKVQHAAPFVYTGGCLACKLDADMNSIIRQAVSGGTNLPPTGQLPSARHTPDPPRTPHCRARRLLIESARLYAAQQSVINLVHSGTRQREAHIQSVKPL
ncbi:hypothetical protein EYF80_038309 [Liparis tanakae]|uniref:Uncharacterized protein n=1 Tax=Liparis tanakae TaxID=230148 RepID=A0A4Z2GDN6_9TELE|nr:hypothetical protein EYF80_038309 [Liparis tanakae]